MHGPLLHEFQAMGRAALADELLPLLDASPQILTAGWEEALREIEAT